MYRILVADDEPRHRRGLAEMIKRLRPAYEVLEAKDGLEAVEVVRMHPVDITITDIKMPFKDGLSFLEEVSDRLPHMKVIILSGFAYFEYAQKALVLGAFDYILKPLNDVRVENMLQKAEKKIENEKREALENKSIAQRLNDTLPVYIEHQLNQWVKNGLAPSNEQELLQLFQDRSRGLVLVTEMSNFSSNTQGCALGDIHELKLNVKYWMKAALNQFSHALSFFDENDTKRMITIMAEKNGAIFSNRLPDCLHSFAEDMKASYGFEVVIGVGSESEDIAANIREAYQTALVALEYKFFYENNWMITYKEIKMNRNRQVFCKYAEETELGEAIRRMDAGQAYEITERLLQRMTGGQFPTPSQFKEMVMIIFLNTAKIVQSIFPEEDFLELVNRIRKDFESAQGYSELRRKLFQAVDVFVDAMASHKNKKTEKMIQSCKEYINEHYIENISLEALSEKFGFHVNYFSGLFKSHTHMTFSEYLLSVRMKHAQELLQKKTLRIYEIAEKVGYKDVKYFNRVFKKTFGLTPDEFRKLNKF